MSKVIGGFGLVMGICLVVVGVMTANPVAICYGGELALVSGMALVADIRVDTIGPNY